MYSTRRRESLNRYTPGAPGSTRMAARTDGLTRSLCHALGSRWD